MKLTKNFDSKEFACRCGEKCGAEISLKFVFRLQELRNDFGKTMKITSGARCGQYNTLISGAKKSRHLEGIAADIAVNSAADKYELVALAVEHGFRGIGVGHNFIHIDDRKGQAYLWTY
jgi:uncharacterized protein YcbK (DUF882 family)